MDLVTSKNIGGIGALLVVIGPLAGIVFSWAGILALIGVIMVLVAQKGLADYYNEGGIFNNALYGFITTIIGSVAFVGTLIISVLMALSTVLPTDWANIDEWAATFTENFLDPSMIFTLLGAIIAALIVLFIVLVIAAIFYRKSLNLTASKSGVGMFGTAGMLLLIGAILSIILIGAIVIWIAFILLTVAFFSIKPTTKSPTPPTSES
ncbi:MAG: DUF996 domain-containing protein [Candidatus Bathyarchaeota archaeon]|jgi:uncharacterized membrane protein